MAKKKTSQEIEETSLGNDDLIRISKESGGSYSNRKIKGSNMKASLSPDLNENEIAFGNSSNKITSSSRLLYEDGALIVVHNGTGENVNLFELINSNEISFFEAVDGAIRLKPQSNNRPGFEIIGKFGLSQPVFRLTSPDNTDNPIFTFYPRGKFLIENYDFGSGFEVIQHRSNQYAAAFSGDGENSLGGLTQVLVKSGSSEAGTVLENTAGRKYTLISTGTGSGIGANKFAIFDATNGLNRFEIQDDGKIKFNDQYIFPATTGSENDILQLNDINEFVLRSPAQIRGYKSFVGAISQSNNDPPTIDSTYVNDWGIVSGDCSYVDEGTYQITKTGIGINFANQNGVGVQTNSSWHITAVDDDTLELTTFKNGLPINGGFTNTLIDLKFPL